ncbi:MAG: bacillithiol biosynthesis BshC, partial [Nitrososphaeria archaeon]|nr:bacillithiol biosynthesis BshC [Nitrososphaeria archaeon]
TYDGEFQVGTQTFSQEDLLRSLEEDPSRFSSNAVIRPITQDYVFPTFAYVSGPNEIAYQAQLRDVYDFLSVEMPLIFPRFGATIVESKVSKVLTKYGVDLLELREPERLLKEIAGERLDDAFREFEEKLAVSIEEVTGRVRSIDETLVDSCSIAKTRIFKAIERMEDKILTELKRRDRIARRQIFKAYNNLFPYGGLQERHINALEYLIKFGDKFLRVVRDEFSKARFGEHRVIRC